MFQVQYMHAKLLGNNIPKFVNAEYIYIFFEEQL